MTAVTYPVRVDASLEGEPSRWLWLVKWLLAVPHYVVLTFLWLAFAALSAVAFVAILATGRYPRSIFEFNVGVLRWTWRVQYYAYGALATDHYPPFALADVPDYPAHLEIAYPERLSRGLVLVKWWLLALPHYLILAVFIGGAAWGASRFDQTTTNPAWFGGLISLLAVLAAVALLVTGRYPRGVFDLVLGMNRWVLRVAAYAALMTDSYPPFRMDLGGTDPAGTRTVPPSDTPQPSTGWTGGRIASLVVGMLVGLVSVASLGAGGTALWADRTMRDPGGYVSAQAVPVHTDGYALTSGSIDLSGISDLVGDVRLRVTSADPVFVGVAPAGSVTSYLSGVAYSTASGSVTTPHQGVAPSVPPGAASIWTTTVGGSGTQTLFWSSGQGPWTVVVMNANGTPGVTATVVPAATLPELVGIAAGLLAFGVAALAGAVLLIVIPVRHAAAG